MKAGGEIAGARLALECLSPEIPAFGSRSWSPLSPAGRIWASGSPWSNVLRQSLIALRLADRLGLDESARAALYYVSLLAWVGCHVDAYEQARRFGDDVALKADFRTVDRAGAAFVLRHLAAGKPVAERARVGVAFLAEGRQAAASILENHWRAADALAAQLGLGQEVRDGLAQTFERWDGRGTPGEASGDGISVASRLVSLADVAEVYHRAGGVEAAVAVARERRGTQFDPALVDLFCAEAPRVFAGVEAATTWDAVIAAAPALDAALSDQEADRALAAVAGFIDLKSPYTLGHSVGVAELTAAAGGSRTRSTSQEPPAPVPRRPAATRSPPTAGAP